jgi:hypothetical protein
MTAAWVATLGGGVAAHFQRASARDAYLAETDPDLVDDRYDTYNAWHKARGALLIGAGAVWAGSVIDALARGAPAVPTSTRLAVSPAGVGLRVTLSVP